ncbi:PaeR7I family type II restriction endonuclease [Streptomyces scopuliridis]
MDSKAHMTLDRALRSWRDVRFAQATRSANGGNAQQGNRAAVTGGRHLDALDQLVRDELVAAGGTELVFLRGRKATLPGYYRATKSWDLLVLQDEQPVLAVEYKSMKGSEGKNLNNRADEVFGVAEDLRRAEKKGLLPATMRRAYVFVMGVTEDSTTPRKTLDVAAGKVDKAFDEASYLERAAIMCDRMRETGLYHLTWAIGIRDDPFGWVEPLPAVGWAPFSQGLRDVFDEGIVKPLPQEDI